MWEEENALTRLAQGVEGDERLSAEMAEWDSVAGDGLELDQMSENERG